MNVPVKYIILAWLAGVVLALPSVGAPFQIGTREQRAAMFEELVQKTMEREAFSEVKNRRLGLDVERAMRACRDGIVEATSEHELLIALNQLSCARRDRHLVLRPIPGGLRPEGKRLGDAPIRFAVDFGEPRCCFVAALAESVASQGASVGDVVVAVHGTPFEDWAKAVSPYLLSSTDEGLWCELAKALSKRSGIWPKAFNPPAASYTLRKPDGQELEVTCRWGGEPAPELPAPHTKEQFDPVLSTQTFDLHVHRGAPVLLLVWHRFGGKLLEDIDRLMALAEEREWLDHDLIWDGTRSDGGSHGAYAVQRLFDRPFKVTFGNLRLSDVIPEFIEQEKKRLARRGVVSGGLQGTADGGNWLLEWLEEDVTLGLKRGQAYSNDVPFKLAHLPKYSDGILQPSRVHFRGKAVCLLGPHGGSHLDQFASIVIDNGLAHTIGMSTGGYSNTWEWQEAVKIPGTDRPLVGFMWSIGHTIRPNGEVLEGNPAEVHDYVPVTRENFVGYRAHLVRRALTYLDK